MVNPSNCIGCEACVKHCKQEAISFQYNDWGEGSIYVDPTLCNNCNLCQKICPSLNHEFNPEQENVYAVISTQHRYTGSSGGVFYELATRFIQNGGVVFGSAFNDELKLEHRKVTSTDELLPLCKSKYLRSSMSNTYSEILSALQNNQKIMFVGTPCQVTAVKNLFSKKYRNQLFFFVIFEHFLSPYYKFSTCLWIAAEPSAFV